IQPSISGNAGKIAYVTERLGMQGAFVLDTATGADIRISTSAQSWSPVVSRDGSTTAFLTLSSAQGKPETMVVLAPGATKECESCERLYSFSPDNRRLLIGGRVSRNNPMFLNILEIASGKQDRLLGWPDFNIVSADWSPDGRWLAVSSRTSDGRPEVWVVSVDGKEKNRITEESRYDDRPRFSPDGRVLYFLSD